MNTEVEAWEQALTDLRKKHEEYEITIAQVEALQGIWFCIQSKCLDKAQAPDCDFGENEIDLVWAYTGTLAYIKIRKDGSMNWFFDSAITRKSRSRLDRTVGMDEIHTFIDLLFEFWSWGLNSNE